MERTTHSSIGQRHATSRAIMSYDLTVDFNFGFGFAVGFPAYANHVPSISMNDLVTWATTVQTLYSILYFDLQRIVKRHRYGNINRYR